MSKNITRTYDVGELARVEHKRLAELRSEIEHVRSDARVLESHIACRNGDLDLDAIEACAGGMELRLAKIKLLGRTVRGERPAPAKKAS